MDHEPLTVKEAAVLLGLTTRTVRIWIESGRLQGERVEGKFGPEWRLDRGEVLRAVDRRVGQPVALDVAGRPGGNDLRALAAVLTSEVKRFQEAQTEHTKHIISLSDKLDALAGALPAPGSVANLQSLIRQSSQVQQTVEEESRTRHREAQELQASVQALSAALHDQAEQVTQLTAEVASLRARPTPWYLRPFRVRPAS